MISKTRLFRYHLIWNCNKTLNEGVKDTLKTKAQSSTHDYAVCSNREMQTLSKGHRLHSDGFTILALRH